MSQDLRTHDRELDALGKEPTDLTELVARYGEGVHADLAQVDVALEGLGAVSGERSLGADEGPATVEQPLDEAGPESGEYSLGPEVAPNTEEGVELDISGEMALPDERSGSYELPTAPADDGAARDPSGAMVQALNSQAPDVPDTEQVDLDAFGDDSEGGADEVEPTVVAGPPRADVTQVVPTEPLEDSQGPVTEEAEIQAREEGDIDDLFDELTNPSSRPPAPSTTEQPLCADGELGGPSEERDDADVEADLARFTDRGDSEPPGGEGYEDDEATAVFDAALFRDLEDDVAGKEGPLDDEVTRTASSNPPPPSADPEQAVTSPPRRAAARNEGEWGELSIADVDIEELEPAELEVMFDEDAATNAPPPRHQSAPPPPPPAVAQPRLPGGEDESEGEPGQDQASEKPPSGGERPSLIGKLFGRRKK